MSKKNGTAGGDLRANKTPEKSNKIKINTDTKGVQPSTEKPELGVVRYEPKVAKTEQREPRNEKQMSRKPDGQRSGKPNRKITRFAEFPAETVTKETKKDVIDVKAKRPQIKKEKPVALETGVVVRERNIDPIGDVNRSAVDKANRPKAVDPEIALMANRASTAERVKPDVVRPNSKRRSMSGMVGETVRPRGAGRQTQGTRASVNARAVEADTAPEEGELRFSKAKSMLIGVGVALVVAVIGFVAIGMFSAKPTCVVSFDSNGGSEVVASEIVCGRTVSRPDDPVKEGFSFEGWILEGDVFDFESGIYKNAILMAKWKANEGTEVVKVKFDSDGGSAVNEIEVAKGKTITMPPVPTKAGYVFEDWYLGDKVFDFATPVNDNITLKAKWTKRQTPSSTSGSSSSSNNGSSSNSTSGNNNNSKPTDTKRVTQITAAGNLTIAVGESGQIIMNIVPSAAEYTLLASSSDESVAACSVARTVVTCTAKKAGRATVTVRDLDSGNRTTFTVTVPSTDKPDVTEPDNPPKKDPDPEPDPDPQPKPDPEPDPEPEPDPKDPDPDEPDPDSGEPGEGEDPERAED